MAYTAGVVGASGYGGAELVRLLDAHPSISLEILAAGSQAGRSVRALFPNLDVDGTFDPVEVDRLAELDLVFLATPHAAAMELGGALAGTGTRVVDLSAAFRLPAGAYERWYGESHGRPELAADGSDAATYGLTEWNRDAVTGARLVANPGCYPTAALLGLLPLVPLVRPETIVVDAKSGTSGAGRGLRDDLHHPAMAGDLAAYGAPGHRHTGEIEHVLAALGGGDGTPISFTPHLVPTVRGLLATCYATLREGAGADDVADALTAAYGGERFVRVLPPGTFPRAKALTGSNGCQLSAVVDERTDRVVVVSAIDNLGKGAAGQAVQNANVMLGIDEDTGLTPVGVYP